MSVLKPVSFAVLLSAVLTLTARAQTPDRQPLERGWISVSGTVVSTTADSFRLDYGKGILAVQVGDWRWLSEGRELIVDHKVTVFGDVDATEGGRRTLRAAGLYDQDLATYYDIDRTPADSQGLWTMTRPLTPGYIEVAGRVIRVNGRELVLNSGMRVDTRELGFNPVDAQGYPQIGVGDRIKAAGYLAKDILESPELVAAWIVELNRQESK